MIKPVPEFEQRIARAGIGKAELARAAGVGTATIYGFLRPKQQLGRVGGLYPQTAWKVARGFAQLTNTTDEEAFTQLFHEVEYISEAGRRITHSPA